MNCTEDVNECENGTVCGPHPCSNYPGGFSCECPDGFDGVPCQVTKIVNEWIVEEIDEMSKSLRASNEN